MKNNPRTPNDNEAALRFVRAALPDTKQTALLTVFGNAHAALSAEPSQWRLLGLNGTQCEALQQASTAPLSENDQYWLEDPRHRIICIQQPEYPDLLREISSPPAVLFMRGNPDLLWQAQLAIVGSRHCSDSGLRHAEFFARHFAVQGWTITSGLAAGIDAAAHRGALTAYANTIAVLACGVDVCYPKRNRALFDQIGEQGLLISEHPPGTQPLASHFPSRNRIIAGLSLGTLVVEANLQSGALITARLAAESGREVFALPGSIHNPHARGCHRLIKQGALLVESPEEVLGNLQPVLLHRQQRLSEQLNLPLATDAHAPQIVNEPAPKQQQRLLRLLGDTPMPIEQLVERSGLTYEQLCPMLLSMELSGLLVQRHGRYQRG